MAGQRPFAPGSGFHPEIPDPVFDPSPEFNFAEDVHSGMPQMSGGPGDFQLYGQMQPGYPSHGQGPPGFGDNFWSNLFEQDFTSGGHIPPSTQQQIVNAREGTAAQRFGQITPPDEVDTKAQQTQESDAAKRKERARNAANKRHAKSKKARNGSESQTEELDGTEVRGERQAHYREKNRVAAAKCRAKKKNHNDNLEEIHREESNKNKILKAELMSLRNELAQLKGLTLEHSPDSCRCEGIHEYSMRQANLIARGAAPQYGASMTTPSMDSPQSQSVTSPVSGASHAGSMSLHDSMMGPATDFMSRKSSSAAPGGWMQSQ